MSGLDASINNNNNAKYSAECWDACANEGGWRKRMLTYAVSIRQHTSTYVRIRQNTSAYVSIRHHTSSYFRTRQHTSPYLVYDDTWWRIHTSSHVGIRWKTSVESVGLGTSVSIVYVGTRQYSSYTHTHTHTHTHTYSHVHTHTHTQRHFLEDHITVRNSLRVFDILEWEQGC
jgi:hypothetical protein